ncbi:hypothetical protein ACWCW7_35165 [Nocardia tengchongensis]
MFFAGGETVTVIRPAAKDAMGDPVGGPTEHDVDGCGFSWQSSTEVTDRRDTVVSTAEMYCPTGADILATDKVRLPDGREFMVDGSPASWRNPFTGWDAGMVVRLKAVI